MDVQTYPYCGGSGKLVGQALGSLLAEQNRARMASSPTSAAQWVAPDSAFLDAFVDSAAALFYLCNAARAAPGTWQVVGCKP